MREVIVKELVAHLMAYSFYDIEEGSHFLCLCGIGTASSRCKTILLHVFRDGSLNNNGSNVFCRLLLQESEMHRIVLKGGKLSDGRPRHFRLQYSPIRLLARSVRKDFTVPTSRFMKCLHKM